MKSIAFAMAMLACCVPAMAAGSPAVVILQQTQQHDTAAAAAVSTPGLRAAILAGRAVSLHEHRLLVASKQRLEVVTSRDVWGDTVSTTPLGDFVKKTYVDQGHDVLDIIINGRDLDGLSVGKLHFLRVYIITSPKK